MQYSDYRFGFQAIWTAMLLNNSRHPTTNITVVPKDVLAIVSRGRAVSHGEPEFPEVVRILVLL